MGAIHPHGRDSRPGRLGAAPGRARGIRLARKAASRPFWVRCPLAFGRATLLSYGITLVLGLAVLPLTGARYHLISLAGILIGPPAILFASAALLAGFVHLLAAALVPPLAG